MTERERWIVYPLLFLALGAALRDKLFDRTTTKSIVCQELTVVDEQPIGQEPVRVLAKIGRAQTTSGSPSYGYLVINGQVDVNGVVNAQQYAYKGVPFAPALQAVLPGLSWPDLIRLLQQHSTASQRIAAPPATPAETNDAQQSPAAPPAAPINSNEPSNQTPSERD